MSRARGRSPFHQITIDDLRELVVDNFAGGGGASTGIALALGRSVDIAINHDPSAIAMHRTNHPDTKHYCESVWEIDPRKVTRGLPVGLAWFSPDCKHFSKAKGGKPVEKQIRGLAWIAIRWAAAVRPRVIMLENVEEFVTWGPLIKGPDGEMYPDPERKSQTFQAFVAKLRRLGYQADWRELRACDYGAPTIRKRFFLIARCDGLPIVWPTPTHGDPKSEAVKSGKLPPWRTAAEIIDWSLPCPSIFERKRPLKDATLRRIARGIMKFVMNNASPFIIPVTHQGSDRVVSIDAPFPTVTAAHRGEHALITAHLDRQFGRSVGHEADAPLGTVTAGGSGKSNLVTAFLAQYHSETASHHTRGQTLDRPTLTVDAANRYGLVTSNLIKLRGTCADGQPVTEPMPTITAGGLHVGEVRAFLLKYYGASDNGQTLDEPLHTVTTKHRFGLVTIQGEDYQIVDIGMRMLQPHELFAAQGFPADYIIDRDADGNRYSKADQVARCGNAVPPPFAKALVEANLPELRNGFHHAVGVGDHPPRDVRRLIGRQQTMRQHLCPACEKTFVPDDSYRLCPECREVRRLIKARWLANPANLERQRAYTRRRKAEAKAAGLCTHCLKRKPLKPEEATCRTCQAKARDATERRSWPDYVPRQRRAGYA